MLSNILGDELNVLGVASGDILRSERSAVAGAGCINADELAHRISFGKFCHHHTMCVESAGRDIRRSAKIIDAYIVRRVVDDVDQETLDSFGAWASSSDTARRIGAVFELVVEIVDVGIINVFSVYGNGEGRDVGPDAISDAFFSRKIIASIGEENTITRRMVKHIILFHSHSSF